MKKNKLVGLILIIFAVFIFVLFACWIIVLPAIGVTDFISNNITSGYWGIAIFTMFEVSVIVIILIWIGYTPLKIKITKNEKE
ncbi:MAG: hypothetical protein ACTSR2_08030 [Candidatus Hodarchaeales archaeon]